MTSQVSRLDRQVILLETGSTQFVRNMAADQMGDLAKEHPEDILSLLSRVYPFLLVKKWETRVTAARAVGGIVCHAPVWDPNGEDDGDSDHEGKVKKEYEDEDEETNAKVKLEHEMKVKLEEAERDEAFLLQQDDSRPVFSLSDWNLHELLKSKKVLLASDMRDYSDDSNIRKQPRMNTSGNGSVYEDTREINNGNGLKKEDPEVPQRQSLPSGNKKSARMLAMAKRKKKMQAKSTSNKPVDLSESSVSKSLMNQQLSKSKERSMSPAAATGTTPTAMSNPKLEITEQMDNSKIMVESMMAPILEKHEKVAGLVWQFQGIFELLLDNLINNSWEVRHGSALGLRELLKKHAFSVSRIKGKSRSENNARNKRALEDISTRLLTVFAIDRFGDFVYDTVVAPVRESVAQTLAALLIHLDDELCRKIFHALEQLVIQDPKSIMIPNKIWEATHGGLLGVRYFVSIKTDFLLNQSLLNNVVNIVLYGLNQIDDDVQSVAAAILSPITDQFVKLDLNVIEVVLTTIWSLLTHLEDDLSSSVGSVMDLLAKLCKHEEVLQILKEKAIQHPSEWSFKSLVPKLYPFLRHSISSVRKAVLNLLNAFLSIKDDSTKSWLNGKVFRLVFQNIILEQNKEILDLSFHIYLQLLRDYRFKHTEKSLDHVFSKHLQPILHLLNTPIGENGKNYSMESQYILKPSQHYQLHPERKRSLSESNFESDIPPPKNSERINIDEPMIAGDITLLGAEVIQNTRIMGAKAFGITLSMFQESTLQSFFSNVLVRCLELSYATPRMVAGIILAEYCSSWIQLHPQSKVPSFVEEIFAPVINPQLLAPESLPAFRELVPSLKALRTQCQSLMRTFVDVGMLPQHKFPNLPIIVQGEAEAGPEAFNIALAEKVYNEYYEKMFRSMGNSYKLLAKKPLEDAKYRVFLATEAAKESRRARISSILSNYAAASLRFSGLPVKLNPVIRAFMDSIKEEKNDLLQRLAGDSIIYLIEQLLANGKANVANKICKNLCGFLCVDTTEVPEFAAHAQLKDSMLTIIKESLPPPSPDDTHLQRLTEEAQIKRKGGLYTLGQLLQLFGSETFQRVTQFHSCLFEPLDKSGEWATQDSLVDSVGQSVVDALGVLRATFVYMSEKMKIDEVWPRFPIILQLLRCNFSVIRYSAARTFADLARLSPIPVMTFIIREVLPLLNSAGSTIDRQGATELVYHLSISMSHDILPYVIFLIVPLLGRMSDSNNDVRSLSTTTFALIIKLVPLEAGISDPEGLPEDLMAGRERERDFIQQMMDSSKAKPFKLPIAIKASLRKYQQEGVNWLAFLNKYHLHGILCDDMGLGKTLQTICIIASDQYLRKEDYEKTHSVETRPLPTLIVCPPSLTGHWEAEFEQYSPFLKTVVYAGGPSTRYPLRDKLHEADIIVTSYDVARNDLPVIAQFDYNYCVLDEGHIIKNAQSKLAKAVKQFRSNHRLILTGTPIQNNVVELWSLFDFLMPGFLGTEKMFQERFAKPIAASRNSKTSSREQEAGALALEALHKQVLPFMLRRLKEDVLSDLPPKIIQDYHCELSDLQKQLYEDFSRKQKTVVQKGIENTADVESKQHIFQALQYMRKLCNHPALVLSPDHPQLRQVENYLRQTHMDLHDISNAPKLLALRNLLFECGIGEQDMDRKSPPNQLTSVVPNVISQHRALIFCQLKDMLDMVENDLFKRYMPSVTYMRLDGSIEARDRQKVVRKFNEDPSIDCLLLTTKVGGLGLNLTGADTVIFVEHDWNPMSDLQAMDRAHRLGQRKVVNVYRIVTKGTLEEKIMGLQKFKMNIASTVVNQQNNGLESMNTNQLLDLFDTDNVPSQEKEEKPSQAANGEAGFEEVANETGLSGKAKEALGELKELWDPSQYEEEYNLDNFIKTLR